MINFVEINELGTWTSDLILYVSFSGGAIGICEWHLLQEDSAQTETDLQILSWISSDVSRLTSLSHVCICEKCQFLKNNKKIISEHYSKQAHSHKMKAS